MASRLGRGYPQTRVFLPTPIYKQLALQLNTPGTFAFTIPAGVNFVDVVLIGGGGGGSGGGTYCGGGGAGKWEGQTLAVGVTVPVGAKITVTVGAGGAGGPLPYAGYAYPGIAGSNSSASSGSWSLTAAGGVAGYVTAGYDAVQGQPAGNFTFDFKTYLGGTAASAVFGSGGSPGSAGNSGSFYYGPGGSGGNGAAWIYTYTNVDVPPQGLSQMQMPMSSAVGMARL